MFAIKKWDGGQPRVIEHGRVVNVARLHPGQDVDALVEPIEAFILAGVAQLGGLPAYVVGERAGVSGYMRLGVFQGGS